MDTTGNARLVNARANKVSRCRFGKLWYFLKFFFKILCFIMLVISKSVPTESPLFVTDLYKNCLRYKCMFATWKQPIASILLAAARLIDNPLDLGDIVNSLSKTMTVESMVHWELSILDVIQVCMWTVLCFKKKLPIIYLIFFFENSISIQVVVLDGATKDQIGGPDKIVDMERGYLHAHKFADPKKEKRKREECFIFMERDSPAYSIVRAAAFGQNTLDEVIVRTVREGKY